ncbi:metallophosphoesterase [Phytoactinopolyspora halotolerans]|uniref:Metallophosphoesterase n=1 Tax=Phytoactinopolyspora halotolerans TaxID=1981512 RepID=A0A6L9S2H5_9ACTN|nr:metallophosphoesterase [Phytoactinopolyspora halotolerans]
MIGLAGLATGGLAYAAGYEVRSYRLRRFDVPVLAPGSRPLRILHLSDLHLTPRQNRKIEWVRSLAALSPDLIVNTGDNIAHRDAVPAALHAFEPLLSIPGVFVFGSNDYYSPRPKNPLSYLLPTKGPARVEAPDLPWRDLRDGMTASGWVDLTNTHQKLTVDDRLLAFVGVDDPHLNRDRYPAGPAEKDADLAIGVAHAPYLRVLDAMATDGYRLLLAGHTHGGQLCVPGYGALVTNCDLDTARVKGVSQHPAHGGPDASWLHVSAGLGTSPYAPVRFACPPEATLLTLTAG